MKLLVFINLASGLADGSSYDFIRSFAQAGDEVVIRYAAPGCDFTALLEDAESFDAVVASGGDGTVATVLYALRNTGIPVLPFPAGTANLLTQNLYSPIDAPALAHLVREGRRLDCDICELEIGDFRTGFTMMAGCGYDARIMYDAASSKKYLGQLAYFYSALTNPTPQVSNFKIDIDGRHIECTGICALLINFSKINADLSLQPTASPCDGTLDLMVVTTETALQLLPTVAAVSLNPAFDLKRDSKALTYYHGKEIRVEADPPMYIQYDGEPLDLTTPFTARVLPGASRLIMGDEAYNEFTSKTKYSVDHG